MPFRALLGVAVSLSEVSEFLHRTSSKQSFCTGVRGKNDWLESVEFNGRRLRQTGKYAKSLLTKRLGKLFGIGTCNTKVFRSLFVLRKVVVVEQEEFIS